MRKTRKMVLLSLFTTVALTIFVIEANLPSFTAIPGVKLGLANCVTLLVLLFWSWKEAGMVLIMRIVLGCMFTGQAVMFLYSLAGGICCLIAMQLVKPILKDTMCWLISVVGAVFHNIGQIAAACFLVKSMSVVAYLPILLISGILTGMFTGFCIQYLYQNKHIRELFLQE